MRRAEVALKLGSREPQFSENSLGKRHTLLFSGKLRGDGGRREEAGGGSTSAMLAEEEMIAGRLF